MKATVCLVMLTALRDRLFSGLFLFIALAVGLAFFLGGTVLTEQLNAAIVFAAGGGRLILVLGLTIFTAFHIQGLFETREVEAILARALSRGRFIFAYWLAFACLAAVLAGILALIIGIITGGSSGALLWGATFIVECMLVLGVAVFAGFMLERAVATVLFTLGFYALSRLAGFFVGIRETTGSTSVLSDVVKHMFDAIFLFVPRLDLFAQTQWLVYGPEQVDIGFFALQSGLFLALVLGAAAFDLSRKQF